mmetsp:Transcript_25631/g.59544  ORF Transcript_25631/g.59544 Transcript_25631/m.59544 type:complete len:106 (-) Transcript_25631:570-887(-)
MVSVTKGPHKGRSVRLQPTPTEPCMVGRSKGSKYREKGISLFKDTEVSTAHGRIEIRNGKVYFVDLKSTNGTQKDGDFLDPYTPLELTDGMELVLGGTCLRFQLP